MFVTVDPEEDPIRVDVAPMAPYDDSIHRRHACSLMGRLAEPADLRAHPDLGGFVVPTLAAHITAANKLSALHRLASAGNTDGLAARARDVYDLACLAADEHAADKIRRNVAALDAHDSEDTRIRHKDRAERPKDGYSASPAFDPRTSAYRALSDGYDRVRPIVYGRRFDPFEQAVAAVRSLD